MQGGVPYGGVEMFRTTERTAIIEVANAFSLASVYAGIVLTSAFFLLSFVM
jgi:hypothetical protein